MTRRFSRRQRRILAWRAGGRCAGCGAPLDAGFHADHVRPFSRGGRTVTDNGQALCAACNLRKGATMTTGTRLRPWQEEALAKAERWLLGTRTDKHFLINAAPGAGKTIAACVIARRLFECGEIDRVMVIAPRSEVVAQWARDFKAVTGRYMAKVTAAEEDVEALGVDVCATWAALQGLQDAVQAVCRGGRVLVICDEHHHAAVSAAWGTSADSAFSDAAFVLILTGTPIRSDGAQSVWLAYDDAGAIDHPDEGSYALSYGEAVDLGYCRPVTFHRHEGLFTVDLDDSSVQVSGHREAELTPELRRIPGLQTALNFYRLASKPQFEADNVTPLLSGYQATMISCASDKLTELRLRMPEAGGLIIAPDIEMAEYMARLLEMIEGEAPIIVHTQKANNGSKIAAFRSNASRRWIVSVAMISEGVDIPRLRVLVYLPKALTELAFRQAIGRVVRTNGADDDTRAYVVMPSFETFDGFARRVEHEMSPGKRRDAGPPKAKVCPSCRSECALGASTCDGCGHEFPKSGGATAFRSCGSCGALNAVSARSCHACGAGLGTDYRLTLDEALRDGVIVRGMDIDEGEARAGEAIAPNLRRDLLRSGDPILIGIVRKLPEESFARLRRIMDQAGAGPD